MSELSIPKLALPQGILNGWIGKILQRVFDELIHDPSRLREYLEKFVDGLQVLADRTETVIDDLVVAGLQYALENDEAWEFAYGKILAFYNAIVNGEDVELDRVSLTSEAEHLGLDPVTLVTLIIEAVKLFSWWWQNRNND